MLMPKKLLLVFNPMSGKSEFASQLFATIDSFTKAGFEVTVRPTQSRADAREYLLEHAESYDRVCVSGGDGTLNEAVNALMALENRPVFSYIPSGSTNDFATSLNIPRDLPSAVDCAVSGQTVQIDIGRFGDKFFAYVAAFGLFTDVTYDTPQQSKNILGHAAYILEGAKRLGSIKSFECEFMLDDEAVSGDFIFGMVSNSISIGGFKTKAAPFVLLDDGLFEVILVKRPQSFGDLQNIVSSMMTRELLTDSLVVRRCEKIRVASQTALDWTLDGEFGGATTDVEILNLRKAFEIMAPIQ